MGSDCVHHQFNLCACSLRLTVEVTRVRLLPWLESKYIVREWSCVICLNFLLKDARHQRMTKAISVWEILVFALLLPVGSIASSHQFNLPFATLQDILVNATAVEMTTWGHPSIKLCLLGQRLRWQQAKQGILYGFLSSFQVGFQRLDRIFYPFCKFLLCRGVPSLPDVLRGHLKGCILEESSLDERHLVIFTMKVQLLYSELSYISSAHPEPRHPLD